MGKRTVGALTGVLFGVLLALGLERALAAVWTDKLDYSPGEVVTISGDNRDNAGYLPGETVRVEVWGPNGYYATCEAVVQGDGSWSCSVTLWPDERAIGEYTYTARGLTSGVQESGVFWDIGNLDYAPASLTFNAFPGATISFTQVITAPAGNDPFTATLKVTGLPSGWTATASPAVLSFPGVNTPTARSWVVTLQVPANATPGSDSMQVKADPQKVQSKQQTPGEGNGTSVTVNVFALPNRPPVAVDDTYAVNEDQTLSVSAPGVLGNDSDPDGNPLTATLVAGPSYGSLTLNPNGSFIYTPNPNFNGTDAFTYSASDGQATSNIATVTITVQPVNDPPTADAGGPYTAPEGGSVQLSGSGSDVDGDSLSFAWDLDGDGTFETSGANVTFSAVGRDGPSTQTVSFRVCDSYACTVATTQVTITNVPPTPAVGGAPASSPEGTPITLTASATDPSPADVSAGFTFTWTVQKDGAPFAAGSGTSFGFTPDDNGTYTVILEAMDKDGGVGSTLVAIAVFNVAPTATFNAHSSVDEGSAFSLSLTDPFDPSTVDAAAGFRYAFDCGDGSGYGGFSNAYTVSCPTSDNSVRTVRGKIRDKDGGETEYTATVTVNNVPPAVTAPSNQTANEGTPSVFDLGAFSDPGADSPWAVAVGWGDGQSESFQVFSTGFLTRSHTYADSGVYTVTVTVTDKDGGFGQAEFQITVNNVPPTAVFSATSPIDEGSVSTLALTAPSDPSPVDTQAGFRYAFACDGNLNTLPIAYAQAGTSSTADCFFPDNGTFTVAGRIFDKDDGFTTYITTVTVNNVPPIVTAPSNQTADEGTLQAFDLGAFSDPGADASWQVEVDWGDGTQAVSFTMATSGSLGLLNHIYEDDGVYTVTVTVTDKDRASGQAQFQITVNNVPPEVEDLLSTPSVINEGGSITLTGRIDDPGVRDLITVSVAWGDGMSDTVPLGLDRSFTLIHTYADDDPSGTISDVYTITVGALDDDGGSGTSNITVTVNNVSPVVGPLSVTATDPIPVGTRITVTAVFTDPGILDQHTVVIYWDWDTYNPNVNTSPSTTLFISMSQVVRPFTASYVYNQPGVYTLRAEVTDDDGGQGVAFYQYYVVVYDPNAGFVTGGGWIQSPPRACRLSWCTDETTGRANFGFVSKYQKGAKVPSGQTQFQFQAGNLNFHSTAYEWLVISGP
ncbi:PKD domain-containing protein, partial [Thermoflexus sp.]|uniref:PKD domain-containing protein n=1 Tax=Thermoflexus sp. TaxID=1969742 RepID=UPI0035E4005A